MEIESRDSEIAPTKRVAWSGRVLRHTAYAYYGVKGVVMAEGVREIVVQVDELREFVCALYREAGVGREDAELVAELQVETDLRGVYSHGTRHAPSYIAQILAGDVNPTPEIRVQREGAGYVLVDGDGGLGHVASAAAMRAAIEKARSTGIAAAGVVNAGHFGAAACFTMMAVEERMIGFATTNTGGPSVTAPGGAARVVGNNPLSYALPAGEEYPDRFGYGVRGSGVGQDSDDEYVRAAGAAGVVFGRGR